MVGEQWGVGGLWGAEGGGVIGVQSSLGAAVGPWRALRGRLGGSVGGQRCLRLSEVLQWSCGVEGGVGVWGGLGGVRDCGECRGAGGGLEEFRGEPRGLAGGL